MYICCITSEEAKFTNVNLLLSLQTTFDDKDDTGAESCSGGSSPTIGGIWSCGMGRLCLPSILTNPWGLPDVDV